MIEISKEKGIRLVGDEYELFVDLTCLHAVIVKNPELIKVDRMAMEAVKKAIEENKIDEILGERR